jgi:protein arginine N-methyltransferase 7
VPGWHFPMMNDDRRNDAYATAIKTTIRQGDLVLDIGTGSGLLAMMAARAGAKHVVACEELALVAHKAQEIIANNHLQKMITVLPKRSTHLVMGIDLPAPADVLITEIFDAAFLGENLKEALIDASGRLVKPGARVIPMAGKIYVGLLESRAVHQQYAVGKVQEFDLSPYNEFSADPYWQVNLKHFPHRFLTEPVQILELSMLDCASWPSQASLDAKVVQDGLCHAICFWFDLILSPEVTLSNAPDSMNPRQGTHWGQCVHILHEPAVLRPDQTVTIRVFNRDRYFHFECEPIS